MTRTRFAPSPTSYMNIESLRNALFAFLIAKHDNGQFVLRIEDTDQKRYDLKSEESIYNILNIFGLNYDEGPKIGGPFSPYVQSDRLNIYHKYVDFLLKNDYAYYCFCDEKDLEKERIEAKINRKNFIYDGRCLNLSKEEVRNKIANGEKYVIRQKIQKEGTTSFHDEVYGDIRFDNKFLEDQVLIKSDGYPTYNFCNVVDDGLMGITHITRGNEYLSSTPKYMILYDAFNFDIPKIIHLPQIINRNNNDENVNNLLEQGYLPKAILNYLALLGWSPKNNKEFFTLDELIKEFNIKNILKSPSNYDIKKLRWFNAHYIKELTDEEYLKFITPFFIKNCNMNGKSREFINKLALLYKNRITYGLEIVELTKMFFEEYVSYQDECKIYLNNKPNVRNIVLTFKDEINKISNWNITTINECLNNVKIQCNVSGNDLYMPIRIAITGMMHGINIVDTIYLIGKEKILNRLG